MQLLADGVTVIVDVSGVVPVLVEVKAGMSPMPLPASPMAVLELVHE